MSLPLSEVSETPSKYILSFLKDSHIVSLEDKNRVLDFLLKIPELQQASITNKFLSKPFLQAFINYIQLPVSIENLASAFQKTLLGFPRGEEDTPEDGWAIKIPNLQTDTSKDWDIKKANQNATFNNTILTLWTNLTIPFSEEGDLVSDQIEDYNSFFKEAFTCVEKMLFDRELMFLMRRQDIKNWCVTELLQWGSTGRALNVFPETESEEAAIYTTIDEKILKAFNINLHEIFIPFVTKSTKTRDQTLVFIYDINGFTRYYQRNAQILEHTSQNDTFFLETDKIFDTDNMLNIPINHHDSSLASPTILEDLFWKTFILAASHAIVHAFEILSAHGIKHSILQSHSQSFVERFNRALPSQFHYQ